MANAPFHGSPVPVHVRAINQLFQSSNPQSHPEGFLADLNPNSEENYPDAMVETGYYEIRDRAPWPAEAGEKMEGPGDKHKEAKPTPRPETIRFQGMRMGYFCVDKDTKGDNIILNRIVTLKEDAGKG